jgi:hypothetical protein
VAVGARVATRRRRLVTGLVAAAAALVVAVTVSVVRHDDSARLQPSDQPSQAPAPTSSRSWPSPAAQLRRLAVGTYLSDRVTFADMESRLREYAWVGADRWIERLREEWGDFDGQIELVVDDDTITASIPGTSIRDQREYDLIEINDSDTVQIFSTDREAECSAAMVPAPEPATNRFVFLEWMAPQSDGVPTRDDIPLDVICLALYGTAPFTATGS